MLVDLDGISPAQVYFTLIQAIVPRPVAWILTPNDSPAACQSAEDYNLAPFSYFTPVASNPPVAVVSIGRKPDGSAKDTLANLQQHKKATVHIASAQLAAEVTESSRTLDHGDSEIAAQQLELVNEQGFALPRLATAPIAIDAQWYDCVEIGEAPQSVVFLKLNKVWVRDDLLVEHNGRQVISPEKLDPLARLGADTYAGLQQSFNIPRPK